MDQQDELTWRLVGEIETVRLKRREEWRGKTHPEQKRFSQEELRLGPCPTFGNLLVRRTRRLPSRDVIMSVADYLECPLSERNDLLICAGYLPEAMPPTEGQLGNALTQLKATLHRMALPAYILAPDWTIYDTNAAFNQLWRGADMMAYPAEKRSLISLIFDQELPFRMRVGNSRRQWAWHAEASVALFKQRVRLRQFDADVRQRLNGYLKLPQFQEQWQTPLENLGTAPSDSFECIGVADTPMRVRYFGISLYSMEYPHLCIYLPGDEAAHQAFPLWNLDHGIDLSQAFPTPVSAAQSQ